MSCFKHSLCTEEREREGWGDWKREKGEGEGGESGEGGIGGVAGMESGEKERERKGGRLER